MVLDQGTGGADSGPFSRCSMPTLLLWQVLDGKGAKYVVETMWMLMEAGLEEVSVIFILFLSLVPGGGGIIISSVSDPHSFYIHRSGWNLTSHHCGARSRLLQSHTMRPLTIKK
jgi:hypothetical protein